jgi:zinc-ribbon domain
VACWEWYVYSSNLTEQEITEKMKNNWKPKYPEETWYLIDIDKWMNVRKTVPKGIDQNQILMMLSQYFYNPADLDRAVEAELQEQKTIFLNFFWELKQVMQALASDPIRERSGLEQPRKRKQINYHTHPPQTITHPRKTIMHPQRPYQDVKNDIANQLSGLTNFTARVKIAANTGIVEQTINTFAPGQGIGKALQQRIATIQAKNRQDGYTRSRQDVEAEITTRQAGCSGSPPALPQQPQQPLPKQPPQRYARQVPVQANCQNCGASNQPGSKFCNQCGRKL